MAIKHKFILVFILCLALLSTSSVVGQQQQQPNASSAAVPRASAWMRGCGTADSVDHSVKGATMKIASRVVRMLATVAAPTLVVAVTPTDASATDITKSYSFGPGTGTHTLKSTFRDFSIPCGTPGAITITTSFKRFGPEDQSHSFLIDIVVQEPLRSGETVGRVASTIGGAVHTSERTLTVNVLPTDGGCSKPWVVRIKTRDGGDAPYTVSGSVALKYAGETRNLTVPTMSNQYLNKGQSRIILIDSSAGCGQGRMVITGIWNHTIGVVPGPMPIAMKFELLNDAFTWSGNAVADATGYSNNELRSELTKLRLVHQVPSCLVGQWKLRITNVSDHDAYISSISAKMTPTCP
jgi:hypothetical protein